MGIFWVFPYICFAICSNFIDGVRNHALSACRKLRALKKPCGISHLHIEMSLVVIVLKVNERVIVFF